MGQAEELYRAIDDAPAIERFVAEQRVEDLHLDFKLEFDFTRRDHRKEFAIALSGLANSDGGIIVWGVDARKDEEGVDAACGLKPIAHLKAFISDLWRYTGEALHPMADGIQHKPIAAADADEGYAVTLVPASDSTPHMAKLGEDRYYKRNGNSFYRMEHFDLEDMFGRRPRPKLDLYVHVRRGRGTDGPGGRTSECRVMIGILNTGRRFASAPYLIMRVNPEYQNNVFGGRGPATDTLNNIPRLYTAAPLEPGEFRFGGGPHVIIHPDVPLEVAGVEKVIHEGQRALEPPDLRIEFRIWAMDARPVAGVKTVPGKDILECAAQGFGAP